MHLLMISTTANAMQYLAVLCTFYYVSSLEVCNIDVKQLLINNKWTKWTFPLTLMGTVNKCIIYEDIKNKG